jgi:hypothetical protein
LNIPKISAFDAFGYEDVEFDGNAVVVDVLEGPNNPARSSATPPVPVERPADVFDVGSSSMRSMSESFCGGPLEHCQSLRKMKQKSGRTIILVEWGSHPQRNLLV